MKRAVNLVASLIVTVAFMWWAFRDTDVSTQVASLKSANYAWVLPYTLCLLAVHVFRALRWGSLLSGMERVPFKKLNEASAIGFMMLLVLPFRLGEFARPFLIAQRSSIRRSAAMTSVVLERIVDGLFVAALFRALLFFVPGDSKEMQLVKLGAWVMFAVFGGGLVFLLLGLWHQERTVNLVRSTVGRFAPGIAHKVADVVDSFVGAMRQLPDRKHIALFFLYTVLYWGVNGLGMMLLARAFDCSGAAPGAACEPLTLTLFQSYIIMCVLVVGVMIPAAPGMAGTFQAATKVGLTLFFPAVLVNAHGLAYANLLWLCQTVQQILFGLLFLSVSHMSFRELAGKMKKQGDAEAEPADDPPVTRSSAA